MKTSLGLCVYTWAALSCACLALTAPAARAVPIVHAIVGGTVDIDVKLDGVVIGSALGVALTGDSVTVDTAALALEAIRIEIAPTMISLSEAFGGYDEITVESAVLEAAILSTLGTHGNPNLFTWIGGGLVVNGSWAATDSNGINEDTSSNPISFTVPFLTAIVNVSPTVQIDQVTINSIDGANFGEIGRHLTIVASYNVLTPEPGTGLLVAVGLVTLAWRRRTGSGTGNGSRC